MLKVFHAAHYQQQRAANVWAVTWVVGRWVVASGWFGGLASGWCCAWLLAVVSKTRQRNTQQTQATQKNSILKCQPN